MKIQTQSCVVNGKRDVAVIAQEVDYRGQGTLVKISRGGICGSDLHYFQEGKVGNFQVRQPMVLGHEVIGEVVASDSPQLPVGQKVALNPSKPCGQCKYVWRSKAINASRCVFSAARCIFRTLTALLPNTKWWIARSVSLTAPIATTG